MATPLALSAAVTSAHTDATTIAAVEFNTSFLHGEGPRIDSMRFAHGNPLQPGVHDAMLYGNQQPRGRVAVRLAVVEAHHALVEPCFDHAMLQRLGVDLTRLTSTATSALARTDGACHPIATLIVGATAQYDPSDFRLDVSIPQAALLTRARGYLDPSHWDDGVTAAIFRYDASVYRTQFVGPTSQAATVRAYAGLQAGFNVGPWRLRHVGSVSGNINRTTRDSGVGGMQYQSTQIYVQRAIAPLGSQLTLGDGFTDGAMFDSMGFRGVQLASDDRMVPDSRRGYAPTVRGIANTNARVQIRQGGRILFETTVAPGAFEIGDLYATGYGGDLDVIVTEADGSVRTWQMPYAATINALRPGVTRFSLTAGQYRHTGGAGASVPWLAQVTLQHGMTNLVTLQGGVTASRHFAAIAGGLSLNTAYGAFAVDLTQSFVTAEATADRGGQRIRAAYNTSLSSTNTNVSLGIERQTGGYLTLADAVAPRLARPGPRPPDAAPASRLQVSVSQPLARGLGAFQLSGSMQARRDRGGPNAQFQISYTNSLGPLSYGLSATRQFDTVFRRWDNRVMLTLGMPLGRGIRSPYATTFLTYGPRGAISTQQSVTGTAGRDNALGYGITTNYGRPAHGDGLRDAFGVTANATYTSSLAAINGNASVASAYRQVGGGISGLMVGYGGGLALSPATGDTLAVVEADDAAGARIANASGARIGPWGRAVISNLLPFAGNVIEIDPYGLPLSVELKDGMRHVSPTAGAVVRARFDTARVGPPVLIRGRTIDDQPLPFGADIADADGRKVGMVAQGGRAIVRGLTARAGTLTVTWGTGEHERCALDYALPDIDDTWAPGEGRCVD